MGLPLFQGSSCLRALTSSRCAEGATKTKHDRGARISGLHTRATGTWIANASKYITRATGRGVGAVLCCPFLNSGFLTIGGRHCRAQRGETKEGEDPGRGQPGRRKRSRRSTRPPRSPALPRSSSFPAGPQRSVTTELPRPCFRVSMSGRAS